MKNMMYTLETYWEKFWTKVSYSVTQLVTCLVKNLLISFMSVCVCVKVEHVQNLTAKIQKAALVSC